jgi:hypothetical protein
LEKKTSERSLEAMNIPRGVSRLVLQVLQVVEIKELLDAISTRGYKIDIPSFEYLSHTKLWGNMYAAVFRNCVAMESTSSDVKDDTVKRLDKLMDAMAESEQEDDTDTTNLIHNIGEKLTSICNNACQRSRD